MAEERLMDDDKDKKYRIRINEDGEEELVILENEEDEEEELPMFLETDEEEDEDELLSPEQRAERERIKAEERAARDKKVAALIESANSKLEQGDFEGAQYALEQAVTLDGQNGKAYALQLKALSRNMTGFLDLEKCVAAAEGVANYSDADSKAELYAMSGGLKTRIDEFSAKIAELDKQNISGKAERRELFAAQKKSALIFTAATAILFLIFLVAAGVLALLALGYMVGIILTIVFGALALIMLFVSAFAYNKLLTAQKKLRLNESDQSTKLGRELISLREELSDLQYIYSSIEQ